MLQGSIGQFRAVGAKGLFGRKIQNKIIIPMNFKKMSQPNNPLKEEQQNMSGVTPSFYGSKITYVPNQTQLSLSLKDTQPLIFFLYNNITNFVFFSCSPFISIPHIQVSVVLQAYLPLDFNFFSKKKWLQTCVYLNQFDHVVLQQKIRSITTTKMERSYSTICTFVFRISHEEDAKRLHN